MVVPAVFALLPAECIQAAGPEPQNTVFINEVESNDADDENDWIEIVNAGDTDVDISDWFVSDGHNPDSGESSEQEPDPPAGENGAGETPSDADGTGESTSDGNNVSNAPAGTGSTADLPSGSQGAAKAPVNVVNTGDSNGPQWGIALAAAILVLVILGMIQKRRKQIHH